MSSLGWVTVVAGTREELAPSPLIIPRSTLPSLGLPPHLTETSPFSLMTFMLTV